MRVVELPEPTLAEQADELAPYEQTAAFLSSNFVDPDFDDFGGSISEQTYLSDDEPLWDIDPLDNSIAYQRWMSSEH